MTPSISMRSNPTMVDSYLPFGSPATSTLCTIAMALGPNSNAREYSIKVALDTGARETWVFADNFRKLDDDWNETDWSEEEQSTQTFKMHRTSWNTVSSLRSANLPEARLEFADRSKIKTCVIHETLKFIAGRYGSRGTPISIDRCPLSIVLAANRRAVNTRFSGMLGLAPENSTSSYKVNHETFLERLVSKDVISKPCFYMRVLPPDIYTKELADDSEGVTSFICFGEWPCSKTPRFVEIPVKTWRSWTIKLMSITLSYPKAGTAKDYEEVEVEVGGNVLLDCGAFASIFKNECRNTLYARQGARWVTFAFANDIAGLIHKVVCDAKTFLYYRDRNDDEEEVVLGTASSNKMILGLVRVM
ncbi:hypothetical protein A0H81_12719 [Grifola frondosa]|uniref:Peptidase A1 domain-containing protein n=1 Tax=Grifola frondosa TaxID=5627 RepID=A0A1C7LRC6_GRIFR|nr:hypothetical protein A0H81_12719 [Grifola frondosa]